MILSIAKLKLHYYIFDLAASVEPLQNFGDLPDGDGVDFVLVSEVKPNGNSGVLTYIPIEDFLERFEQLGN